MNIPQTLPDTVKWLAAFPRRAGYFEISPIRAYAHREGDYDSQYGVDPANFEVGHGAVALLKMLESDFTGPALEIGCGTGLLTVGLVAANAFPAVVITDPSPEFLHLTDRKLRSQRLGSDSKAFYATLAGEQLALLPKDTFSLITLRSALHHVLDIGEFLKTTSESLKPGGALLCEEPCAEGFLVMGLMAQFIPVVMARAGRPLSAAQENQLQHFCGAMKFYLRRDLDKSTAEDKHLFRVDDLMKQGKRYGLSMEFFPNRTFPEFNHVRPEEPAVFDGYQFMKMYLQYCMNFSPEFIQAFDQTFAPYTRWLDEIARGHGGPPFHGVFLWRKAA